MRNEQRKYGTIAILMFIFIVGGLLCAEYQEQVNLLGYAVFCLSCGAMLLFCLMKLNVMEFQPGSFWDRLNQQLNQPAKQAVARPVPSQKRAVVNQRANSSAYYRNVA